MRVRGLKHNLVGNGFQRIMSHPMRVRGLKRVYCAYKGKHKLSHPMRVRGLKLSYCYSFVGSFRRTPCGCVD